MLEMEKVTDTEIIQLLRSGEKNQQNQAFRLLYRYYFGLIENLVLNNKGVRDDAKDIFQEGLIVLFKNVKNQEFRLQSTIKTYLYSICRNLWLMQLRKTKREVVLEEKHDHISVEENQFKVLEMTEKKRILLHLLKGLNDSCREILMMFYFRKMKMEEIRTLLNLKNEQVAKNKKSRCMKNIRSKVRESEAYQQVLMG